MVNYTRFGLFSVILLSNCVLLDAAITVSGPTTDWTAVNYPGVQSDYLGDQQTGIQEFDIVGDSSHAGIYTQFFNGGDDTSLTDGELAFRFRMGGNKSPSYFEGVAWMGMDVNADGALDLFVGVDNPSASTWNISIRDAGTGANTSPSTTTISSTSLFSYTSIAGTYNWAPVTSTNDPSATNFDLNGDGTDYFISFKIPFADLVSAVNTLVPGADFDETKPVAFVAATATQGNSLNADLNGVQAGRDSTLTWEALGALSPEQTADGTPVPEPGTFAALTGLGALAFLVCVRRRRIRSCAQ